jgi:hypothetical protein
VPMDSLLVDGVRVYSPHPISNRVLIPRGTGCHLETSRYRFYEGNKRNSVGLLSPWQCRHDFLQIGTTLRSCSAGLSVRKIGRGNAAILESVRPAQNPTHSWAFGLMGLLGSFTLGTSRKIGDEHHTLSPVEVSLDQECSAWRALLREAMTLDYSEWEGLAKRHPKEWVRELLAPLPLTIEARNGAPTARVDCQSLLDVLIVTTQLDGIRGLRYRICKADGCDGLFSIGNYKHKMFCDYECAHRQTVRDGRKRKREALEKENSKKTTTKTKGRVRK